SILVLVRHQPARQYKCARPLAERKRPPIAGLAKGTRGWPGNDIRQRQSADAEDVAEDVGARARMKTILVPTEQSPTMVSALDTALLLARKFDSCIEGFALRPAVADLVAMDPDSGLTMVAVKENDAEMVRQAETAFRSFMDNNRIPESAGRRRRHYHGHGSPMRRAAMILSAAMAGSST